MYVRPQTDDESETGGPTTFGVSGKLWRDALVMYDRSSRSLWSQIDGVAKAGPRNGDRLESIPSQVTTWRAWRSLHPETLVLVKPPLDESPYASYHDGASWVGLPWTRGGRDQRLPAKQLVIGVDLADDGAVAVATDTLAQRPMISGEIAEHALLIAAPGDPRAARVFSRHLGERTLTFTWQAGRLVDDDTGSTWDPHTGLAMSGPLAGEALEAVAATPIYWSTWVSFHPQTALW